MTALYHHRGNVNPGLCVMFLQATMLKTLRNLGLHFGRPEFEPHVLFTTTKEVRCMHVEEY